MDRSPKVGGQGGGDRSLFEVGRNSYCSFDPDSPTQVWRADLATGWDKLPIKNISRLDQTSIVVVRNTTLIPFCLLSISLWVPPRIILVDWP